MNMIIPFLLPALLSLGALACSFCSLLYFRYVRIQRPPIGIFRLSDLLIICVAIIVIPIIYLALPSLFLTALLTLLLMNILHICLRPMLSRFLTWLCIILLLAGDILATLVSNAGWQPGAYIHWFVNDLLILIVAVGAANIYVQYGIRIRYVAWLALFLACYDAFFTWAIPLTPLLASHFAGVAFEPAFGLLLGTNGGIIGLGDLFLFALTTTTLYKGFGSRGIIASLILVVCFGIILPPLALPLVAHLIGRGNVTALPVQVVFGPALFVLSYWLSWRFKERSVRQWAASLA